MGTDPQVYREASMPLKVLFVDDEPRVLEGLGRILRPLRQEWDMHFARSGAEALDRLAQSEFHVLVTDVRMPDMDGVELLTKVRQHYPQVLRIVLTGQCGPKAGLQVVRMAHRQLSKPCDPDELRTTVQRIFALRELLGRADLLSLLSQLESVPSMPEMYTAVVEELESAKPSLQRVGEIIARDVGIERQDSPVDPLRLFRGAFPCFQPGSGRGLSR